MVVLGIDVGLNGAIAQIDHEMRVRVTKVPTIKVDGKRDYLLNAMLELLPLVDGETICAIELVHAMPKQGVTSTFRFGRGLGLWEMALVARSIPYRFVAPHVWKKKYGLTGKPKEAAILEAARLFPSICTNFRKSDDGLADALLLAHYGKSEWGHA